MDKLPDNPTPRQVRDFYDLHTGEGAANFSREEAASLDLWHALNRALEDNERLREAIENYKAWVGDGTRRYEPDNEEARLRMEQLSASLKEGE